MLETWTHANHKKKQNTLKRETTQEKTPSAQSDVDKKQYMNKTNRSRFNTKQNKKHWTLERIPNQHGVFGYDKTAIF